MTFSQNTIQVEKLQCSREDKALFHPLSFTLSSGKTLWVKGANGSGKTTLLKTIAGLLEYEKGRVLYNDREINTVDHYHSHIHFLAHKNSIKIEFSVLENIMYFSRLLNIDLSQVDIEKILHRLNLTSIKNKSASQISAGQQRRVALSRLLIAKRPIWILDEPTNSLDENGIAILHDIVLEQEKANGVIMISAHADIRAQADILAVESLHG